MMELNKLRCEHSDNTLILYSSIHSYHSNTFYFGFLLNLPLKLPPEFLKISSFQIQKHSTMNPAYIESVKLNKKLSPSISDFYTFFLNSLQQAIIIYT